MRTLSSSHFYLLYLHINRNNKTKLIMNKLKIFHIGDMQIELRVTGVGAQRYLEFDQVLNINTINAIKQESPDLVVIPGDLFEFELTTADEQKMLSKFLHKILEVESVNRIIIIPGNHDIKQNHNGIIVEGEKINTTDSIDSIVSSINDPRISYYRHTGIYDDSKYALKWAVWSQVDKHSAREIKPAYSPWINNTPPETPFIELYHDPTNTCVSFDGKTPFYFENYKVSLNDFKSNCILAADIHAPQITWFGDNKDRLFTYPSSTVMRNFGEGDYYRNHEATIFGNKMHGYNIIEYDLEAGKPLSCEFKRIENPVHRFTIYLDDKFIYAEETIKQLALTLDQSSINLVRIVCESNISEFIKSQELLLSIFKTHVSNVKLEFAHSENVLGIEVDEEMFEDLENIINNEKILEIADKYIDQVVTSTSIVSIEDKEEVKNRIYEYLSDQLNKTDLTSDTNTLNFISLELENFMNFDVAEITFQNNKINVVKGANRVGKTTVMHGLNWILSDQISKGQNLRNTKYNNLLYFNNNSELDEVKGRTVFLRNNKSHELTKTITRTWKRNQKDIKAKDILNRISAINVEYSLIIDGTQTLNSDETKSYLEDLFEFDSLSHMTFINSSSIDDMMNMSVENMSQSFLEIMGVDISGILESMFEELKATELNKVTKPLITLEEVLSKVQENTINQDKLSKDQYIKVGELSEQESLLANLKNEIVEKRKALHQVMSKDEYDSTLQNFDTSIQNNEDKLKAAQVSLSEFKEIDESEIQTKSNTCTQNIINSHGLIGVENQKINELQTELSSTKDRGSARRDELSTIANQKIQELHTERSAIQTSIYSKDSEIVSLKTELEDLVRRLINVEQEKITTSTEKITRHNDIIAHEENTKRWANDEVTKNKASAIKIREEIEKLKHSTTCTQCLQVLPEEAIEVINAKIAKMNIEALDLEDINNKHVLTISQNELLINGTRKLIDDENKLIEEYTSKINTYKTGNFVDTDKDRILNLIPKLRKDIEESNVRLNVIDAEIAGAEQSKLETLKADQVIKDIIVEINIINEKIAAHKITIESIKDEITKLNSVKASLEAELINAKTHNELKAKLTSEITQYSIELNNLNSYKSTHLTLEPKILENIEINIEILNIETKAQEIDKIIRVILDELNTLKTNIKILELEAKTNQETIENIRNYKLVDSSLTLYKRIIGKKGLPQYVFAHLIPLLNKKLNESLSDVDFRLLFDHDTLELRFYSLTKDVTQPLQFISGMERTVTGLAIAYIKRLLNHSTKFNFIFIDEISGTLNDGKELSYEAQNYQEIVKSFIDKLSQNVAIYIIDHTLKFENSRVLEVVPGPNGSIIKTY